MKRREFIAAMADSPSAAAAAVGEQQTPGTPATSQARPLTITLLGTGLPLVLQRWDQGAARIPNLQVYGPPPIARMTEQLFGENGVYGP